MPASELVQIGEGMLLYALITSYGRSHAYTFDRTQGDLCLLTGLGWADADCAAGCRNDAPSARDLP